MLGAKAPNFTSSYLVVAVCSLIDNLRHLFFKSFPLQDHNFTDCLLHKILNINIYVIF